MYLIVGLGNPGEKYRETRHNLGFKVIEELMRRTGITLVFNRNCQALEGKGQIDGEKVILAMSQTFMNNSGEAVAELLKWHKLSPKHLILIYDDVDLEIGQLRVREEGSAGGHHGVESVIAHLKTTEFARVRIGIGREALAADVTEYVLSEIPPSQKPLLDQAILDAADAVWTIITHK